MAERATREAEVLRLHFEDLGKQTRAAHLGMWIFLATEVLLFGGLFTVYAGLRTQHARAFAEAAHHTDLWIATAGTVVLLLASLLVALSVHAVRGDASRTAAVLIGAAALLGTLFLGLKGWEYARHVREGILPGPYYHYEPLTGPGVEAFFNLYYVMTGLHAVHVAIGVGVLLWVALGAWRRRYHAVWHTPLELAGMYWHLVDVVWLFLWPCFYLMR